MVDIPLFTGFYTSQVVQDFFYQEYVSISNPMIHMMQENNICNLLSVIFLVAVKHLSKTRLFPNQNKLSSTCRIIPNSKYSVTPMYKPFRPFGRGTTPLRGLTHMVVNHLEWSSKQELGVGVNTCPFIERFHLLVEQPWTTEREAKHSSWNVQAYVITWICLRTPLPRNILSGLTKGVFTIGFP